MIDQQRQDESPCIAIQMADRTDTDSRARLIIDDPIVESRNVNLYYGKSRALVDITMDFPRGEVTALIGPSGCGKSTFLRCLNRMNDLIDGVRVEGSLRFEGQDLFDKTLDVIELRPPDRYGLPEGNAVSEIDLRKRGLRAPDCRQVAP